MYSSIIFFLDLYSKTSKIILPDIRLIPIYYVQVRGVCEGSAVPGAPKKADDRCFFDLQTSKRNYSLCAENKQQAIDWQEKIQSCLWGFKPTCCTTRFTLRCQKMITLFRQIKAAYLRFFSRFITIHISNNNWNGHFLANWLSIIWFLTNNSVMVLTWCWRAF